MKSFSDVRQFIGIQDGMPTGQGVIVGVMDTGISELHPLLTGKVLQHFDFTGTGTTPVHPHGTETSSCIANIAPDARFIDCKVLDNQGNGDFSILMRGIEAAIEGGATIISMSLGGGGDCQVDSVLARFMDSLAESHRVMFVAAGGNDGPGQAPMLPALARSCIAVGALSNAGAVADFSSRGPACGNLYPDCSQLGVEIELASIDGRTAINSGTSFSCPMVAGICAMLQEFVGRTLTRTELETVLQSACTRMYSVDKNNNVGWGFLTAGPALQSAATVAQQSPPPSQQSSSFLWLAAAAVGAVLVARKL